VRVASSNLAAPTKFTLNQKLDIGQVFLTL